MNNMEFQFLASVKRPGIIVTDIKQTILFCNTRTADIAGYKPEELIGKHLNVIVPQRFQVFHSKAYEAFTDSVAAVGRAVISSRFNKPKQLPLLTKDGNEVVVDITLHSIICKNDDTFIMAFMEDSAEMTAFAFEYIKEQTAKLTEKVPNP